MKKTQLAALFSSLLFVGCGTDVVDLPDLEPAMVADMEVVIVDATDPDAAWNVDQSAMDESAGFATVAVGQRVFPTSGAAGELAQPGFAGSEGFVVADTQAAPRLPSRPAAVATDAVRAPITRQFPESGEGEVDLSEEFAGADSFANAGLEPRPRLQGRPAAVATDAVEAPIARQFPESGEGEVNLSEDFAGADSFADAELGPRQRLQGRPAIDDPDVAVRAPIDARRVTPPSIDNDTDSSDDAAPRLPADPCDCEDQRCLSDWVAANLGCNVCATFICSDDESMGACYRCE